MADHKPSPELIALEQKFALLRQLQPLRVEEPRASSRTLSSFLLQVEGMADNYESSEYLKRAPHRK